MGKPCSHLLFRTTADCSACATSTIASPAPHFPIRERCSCNCVWWAREPGSRHTDHRQPLDCKPERQGWLIMTLEILPPQALIRRRIEFLWAHGRWRTSLVANGWKMPSCGRVETPQRRHRSCPSFFEAMNLYARIFIWLFSNAVKRDFVREIRGVHSILHFYYCSILCRPAFGSRVQRPRIRKR